MLEKIMKLFKVHFSSNLTLKDSTPLYLNGTLENGVQVFVITEDGNVALPDGEYQLQDDTIIMVKEGLIFDIIQPTVDENKQQMAIEVPAVIPDPIAIEPVVIIEPEPVVEPVIDPVIEEPVVEPVKTKKTKLEVDEIELGQKGNPDISGDSINSGKTDVETSMDPETDSSGIPEDENKMNELETKVANLETQIAEILSKLNLIADKYSAVSPISKRVDVDYQPNFNQDIMEKVEMIKKLKKS